MRDDKVYGEYNFGEIMRQNKHLGGVGLIIGVPGKKGDTGHTDTDMLVDIFDNYHSKIHIFTGDSFQTVFTNPKVRLHKVKKPFSDSCFPKRLIGQLYYQLGLAYNIARYSKEIDINYFSVGGELLLIPLLVSTFLKKKKVVFILGSIYRGYLANYPTLFGKMLAGFIRIGQNLGYLLFDRIITLSNLMIKFEKLEKFRNKIIVWHYFFLDTARFRCQNDFTKREKIVGYIGRTSKVKGFLKFINAIPIILSKDTDIRFIIVGDGQQLEEGKEQIKKYGIADKVEFKGWLPREKLPDYLNKIKLLVMPSESEGLPNVLIETMACGAVPMATPVGDIPFLLKDRQTGYVLEDNSPETIAHVVIEALSNKDLSEISRKASKLATELYNFETASKGYNNILREIEVSDEPPKNLIS